MYSKEEMIWFVDDQMSKGLSRIDAIRNLAWFMDDEDDPLDDAEIWFQQKIGGE